MNKFLYESIANHLEKYCKTSLFRRNASNFIVKDIHEPKYLDWLKPQIPYYPLLNVQIRGYDYATLESYTSYLHKLFNRLGVSVVRCWCAPHVAMKYDNLKRDSEAVQCSHYLNLYERNIQIENLSAKLAPILIEVISSSLPAAIRMSIHAHDYDLHEKPRYIPDLQLAAYKEELKELLLTSGEDIDVKPAK